MIDSEVERQIKKERWFIACLELYEQSLKDKEISNKNKKRLVVCFKDMLERIKYEYEISIEMSNKQNNEILVWSMHQKAYYLLKVLSLISKLECISPCAKTIINRGIMRNIESIIESCQGKQT